MRLYDGIVIFFIFGFILGMAFGGGVKDKVHDLTEPSLEKQA